MKRFAQWLGEHKVQSNMNLGTSVSRVPAATCCSSHALFIFIACHPKSPRSRGFSSVHHGAYRWHAWFRRHLLRRVPELPSWWRCRQGCLGTCAGTRRPFCCPRVSLRHVADGSLTARCICSLVHRPRTSSSRLPSRSSSPARSPCRRAHSLPSTSGRTALSPSCCSFSTTAWRRTLPGSPTLVCLMHLG